VLLPALAALGCRPSGAFRCFSAEECVVAGQDGSCEINGWCAFADDGCPSGKRYAELSGDGVAGLCVGEEPAPPDAAPPDATPPGQPDASPPRGCGTIGDECCATGSACDGTMTCAAGIGGGLGVCGCGAGLVASGVYSRHGCAIQRDGSAWCWGLSSQGQLGNGNAGGAVRTPVKVMSLGAPSQLATGRQHSCALVGGEVSCWGDNDLGQLGAPGGDRTTPKRVMDLVTPLSVSTGGDTTCAVVTGDTVWCWGRNDEGQVGDGSKVDRNKPAKVPNLFNVDQVSAGVRSTCAIQDDGTPWCWGGGDEGQLGDGGGASSLVPKQVQLSGVREISVGDDQACGRRMDGSVWCWGDNEFGVCGDEQPKHLTPVAVAGLSQITQIDVADEFACARRADGKVLCWGQNDAGQLGRGNTSVKEPVPAEVPGINDALFVTTGAKHACATRAAGFVECWGANSDGQLGDGSPDSPPMPVVVQLACP
jgi:alpha-tubulin suppressor-like RCC1 family protein